MKIDPRAMLAIAVMVIIGASAYAFAFSVDVPYAGGGEIGSTLSTVTIEDTTWGIYGQHTWPSDDRSDVDGDYEDLDLSRFVLMGDYLAAIETIKKPGISVESSHPYYLKEIAPATFTDPAIYRSSEEAVISNTYTKNYVLDGESYMYQYNLIPYGVDVIIKTDADRFLQRTGTLTAGWNYESLPVDINLLLNFGMNPWTPSGLWADSNNSYSIIDGWAGILQAEIYDRELGVLQNERLEQELDELDAGARYEAATVIQDLNTVPSALNMWIPGTEDAYNEIDFESPSAIASVRNAVNIEVGAKLGAGAVYTAEAFTGYTTTIAVRNVFVTYRIVVKIVATLNLKLIVEGAPVGEPGEGGTAGDPPPIPVVTTLEEAWNEFWADVAEFFSSPIIILYIILILVIIVGVVYFIVKLRFGRS